MNIVVENIPFPISLSVSNDGEFYGWVKLSGVPGIPDEWDLEDIVDDLKTAGFRFGLEDEDTSLDKLELRTDCHIHQTLMYDALVEILSDRKVFAKTADAI